MEPQDPLAQLRDIHLPNAISLWPPAPGWWIVALIAIIIIALISIVIRQRAAANYYRKLALIELKTLDKSDHSSYLQQLNQLLKQTAIASGCNHDVGSISGNKWLIFLDQSFSKRYNKRNNYNGDCFSNGVGEVLGLGPYAKHSKYQLDELENLAQRWIKHHNTARYQTPC